MGTVAPDTVTVNTRRMANRGGRNNETGSHALPRFRRVCRRQPMDRAADAASLPADGAAAGLTLERVAAETAPFRDRLVELLAPWDRARLRTACRTLADVVPARSCAPSLWAMVCAGDGGAALLRHGAGDARPSWIHAQLAAAADAADALRWLLARRPDWATDGDRMSALKRLTRLSASVEAWRVVASLVRSPTLLEAEMAFHTGCEHGPEALAAECAAELSAALTSVSGELSDSAKDGLRETMRVAEMRNVPAALVRLLYAVDEGGRNAATRWCAAHARCYLLALGRRELAEPFDWHSVEPATLVLYAVQGGELALAEEGLLRHPQWRGSCYCAAAGAHRGTRAVLDWASARAGGRRCDDDEDRMKHCAILSDVAETLRWLSEHTSLKFDAGDLWSACFRDAVDCAAYLMDDVGVRPTTGMLATALDCGAHRVAAAVGVRTGPLTVAEYVKMLLQRVATDGPDVRATGLLRRLSLLPPPDMVFLRAFLDDRAMQTQPRLLALALAGYRVCASDRRAWLASVAPHCPAALEGVWRPLAHRLYNLWHRVCAEL